MNAKRLKMYGVTCRGEIVAIVGLYPYSTRRKMEKSRGKPWRWLYRNGFRIVPVVVVVSAP